MAGIAGIIDLTGSQTASATALRHMARALAHRGPDLEGFHEEPGISLAWRGLHVDKTPEQQPASTEDGTVFIVCQGKLYNLPHIDRDLRARGHVLRTSSHAEPIA